MGWSFSLFIWVIRVAMYLPACLPGSHGRGSNTIDGRPSEVLGRARRCTFGSISPESSRYCAEMPRLTDDSKRDWHPRKHLPHLHSSRLRCRRQKSPSQWLAGVLACKIDGGIRAQTLFDAKKTPRWRHPPLANSSLPVGVGSGDLHALPRDGR